MKNMKKIISLLMAAVMVASLFAYGSFSAGAVSKIKWDKGDFYLQLNRNLYNDGFKHPFKIYAFNVNSQSARNCNRKLYNYLKKFYNMDYDAYVKGYSLDYAIKGSTYRNGNILSIKQKVTGSSFWQYKTFNVNRKTGKRITNSKLFRKYGYSKSGFYKALKRKQVKRVKKIIRSSPGLSPYSGEMLSYARSSASRKGLQVYVDNSGKLCAVAKLNTFAGAGIYQYIFRFSKR